MSAVHTQLLIKTRYKHWWYGFKFYLTKIFIMMRRSVLFANTWYVKRQICPWQHVGSLSAAARDEAGGQRALHAAACCLQCCRGVGRLPFTCSVTRLIHTHQIRPTAAAAAAVARRTPAPPATRPAAPRPVAPSAGCSARTGRARRCCRCTWRGSTSCCTTACRRARWGPPNPPLGPTPSPTHNPPRTKACRAPSYSPLPYTSCKQGQYHPREGV